MDNLIPYDLAVHEMPDLPLKDHVRDRWPDGNTERLLGAVGGAAKSEEALLRSSSSKHRAVRLVDA